MIVREWGAQSVGILIEIFESIVVRVYFSIIKNQFFWIKCEIILIWCMKISSIYLVYTLCDNDFSFRFENSLLNKRNLNLMLIQETFRTRFIPLVREYTANLYSCLYHVTDNFFCIATIEKINSSIRNYNFFL